jgi:6-phosphogluconolactonase (cycloisomerase 2 family)
MKNAILSLSLAATIFLVGCAGFFVSQNPCTGSDCSGGGGSSTTSGLFYVINQLTNDVIGYQVTTGTLGAITNGSAPITGPTSIAMTPNNAYLYVGTTAGIYYYSVSSTGELTLENSAVPVDGLLTGIQSMQIDSTNGWLIVAQQASAQLVAIPLNTSGASIGAPSGGTAYTVTLSSATPQQLVISPDNKHIFVALGTGGTDEIPFTASSAASPFGTDANNPVKATGGAATAVAVDPTSEFLYIAETLANPTTGAANTGGLRVLAINSSANTISEESGSPYALDGITPSAILADHSGYYVYVTNRTVSGQTDGNITGFGTTVSTTAGVTSETLKELANSPYSAGTTTNAIVEDNTYSFVIALNFGGGKDMDIYTFNTTNAGNLDQSISSATGTDPTGAYAVAAAH